jgi:hypothetical protein
MAGEFCLKMPDFHVKFRDLLHAVTRRLFRPEKSDGFGRV